jgi:hypothetical protein
MIAATKASAEQLAARKRQRLERVGWHVSANEW